jgi:hypothetical protein
MANDESRNEAYKLSKELISNNDAIGKIREKMKGDKESIKAFDERNVIIMGELRVHVEAENLTPETY